jgi:hypothetical protein
VIGDEGGQVSVIRDDLDGMWRGFQNGEPFFEGPDNCKKFFLMCLMVYLSWGMLP